MFLDFKGSFDQFTAREGEAPAEPLRRKLGRSLALPLFFNSLSIAKMFAREGEAPAEPLRRQLGRSLALPILWRIPILVSGYTW